MFGLRRRLFRFQQDVSGVAAIEFAIILPILLILYFGTVEIVRIADSSRKLTLFARTVADLSGRADNSNPSNDNMTAITGAASAIMRPVNLSGLQVVISAMGVESVNGALFGGVCSSWPQNARARLTLNGTNGLPPTPAAYQYDGARYILAEVSLAYKPLIGSTLYSWIFGTDGLAFKRQVPWAERTLQEIVMPGGTACPVYN